MLITIIIIVVGVFIYMFLSDEYYKNKELTNDSTLAKGIFNKYSQLFEYFKNKGLTVGEISRSEVKMVYIIQIPGFVVHVSISVIYQGNTNLQFLVQLNLTVPIYKHIRTTSFFYSANASENELISWSEKDISNFVKNTLENLN